MGENQYVAAQIDEDSPLYQQFAEYEREGGFESRSEAIRSVMRSGLNAEKETEESNGLLMQLAGNPLAEQTQLLGWFLTFTAVGLWAAEAIAIATPLWLAMAVVFGFLALATTLAIAVSVGQSLRPSTNSNTVEA